jgi:carnitine 3-dehydrogenase
MAAQHTVAVIGVGTVGQSWAALFLSYGNRVRLWDPAEGLADRFAAYLETVVTEEPLPPQPELGGLWVVCDTVEEALDGATFVQENAPENMDTKHAMLRQIDEALPTDVIVGSSTSSFLLVDMVAKCTRAPSRFVLSHPFNREPPPPLPPPLPLPQPSARCSTLCGRSVQLRT